MKISNIGLSAFYQCAIKESMTEAALALGVTQSALSQRIASLEDDLEATLFIRENKRLKLTKIGQELLDYCHYQASLEDQVLSRIKSDQDGLAGTVRIGAYSSILRSIVIPKLGPMLRKHSKVMADFKSYEMNVLVDVLKSAKADLIITDYHPGQKGIIETVIGHEEFVVIESIKYKSPQNIYLDHGIEDQATSSFFAEQKAILEYQRQFMGDVYGIIDGVEQGLGRAVMSRHLIEGNKKIKIVSGFRKYLRPIVVSYFERPYYSKVFKETLNALN